MADVDARHTQSLEKNLQFHQDGTPRCASRRRCVKIGCQGGASTRRVHQAWAPALMPPLWVPEGNLAGCFVRHGMALEWVCGADFSWKLMCWAGPGDLRGSRGPIQPKIQGKPGQQFPVRLPSGIQVNHLSVYASDPEKVARDLAHLLRGHAEPNGPLRSNQDGWVPEGSLTGNFRPGFPGNFDRNRSPRPP